MSDHLIAITYQDGSKRVQLAQGGLNGRMDSFTLIDGAVYPATERCPIEYNPMINEVRTHPNPAKYNGIVDIQVR